MAFLAETLPASPFFRVNAITIFEFVNPPHFSRNDGGGNFFENHKEEGEKLFGGHDNFPLCKGFCMQVTRIVHMMYLCVLC